jgi:hypothetical protein
MKIRTNNATAGRGRVKNRFSFMANAIIDVFSEISSAAREIPIVTLAADGHKIGALI